MLNVRQPNVAGAFYPGDSRVLEQAVRSYLDGAKPAQAQAQAPKAIVAPHAGYVYSGPVAGSAYAQLMAGAERISRVIL